MSDIRKQDEGWVGFDLDGTLAHYDGVSSEDHIGEPIEPMVREARKLIQAGRDVRIFTARAPHPAIRKWCYEHLGAILPITATKDYKMQALYDDRAVGVVRNEGKPFSEDNVKQVFEEHKHVNGT